METTDKQDLGEASISDEYERLKAEHAMLDEKINALEETRHPSADEEHQIKVLKKQKLALKTRLEKHQSAN